MYTIQCTCYLVEIKHLVRLESNNIKDKTKSGVLPTNIILKAPALFIAEGYKASQAPKNPLMLFIPNKNYTRMKKKAIKRAQPWELERSNYVNVGIRELVAEEYDKYDPSNPPPHPYPYHQDIYTNYSYRYYARSEQAFPDLLFVKNY